MIRRAAEAMMLGAVVALILQGLGAPYGFAVFVMLAVAAGYAWWRVQQWRAERNAPPPPRKPAATEAQPPPPSGPATAAPVPPVSAADEIAKLADLHAKGHLSDEEFKEAKARALEDM